MAYSGAIGGNLLVSGEHTPVAITGTNTLCTMETGGLGFEVQCFGIRFTTAPTGTAGVISLFARITNGSATGERLIGRITIPDATYAVNDVVRGFIGVRTSSSESGDVDAIINPGEAAILRVTTAQGTAGGGIGFIHGTPFAVGDAITASSQSKPFGSTAPSTKIYNLTVTYS